MRNHYHDWWQNRLRAATNLRLAELERELTALRKEWVNKLNDGNQVAAKVAFASRKPNNRKEGKQMPRTIEIFSAGCGVCEDTIKLVKSLACPSCDVTVLDMQQSAIANRAKELGIKSVPAVVIDGKLASCCEGRGPDMESLKAAGLGQPI